MSRPEVQGRRGFAAPLAVCMLITVSLLALLMIEGALGELRTRAAEAAEARVVVVAETAMADALARRLDSTAFALPVGAVAWEQVRADKDSVVARLQVLSQSRARVVVTVHSGARQVRAFAGICAFVRLVRSPSVSGEVVLTPLGPNWWVPTP